MSNQLSPYRARLADLFEGPFLFENGNLPQAPLNIVEADKYYEVSLDVPGMKTEDVQVEFKEGHLWITGERKEEKKEEGKKYHRVERRYGRFRRVIALPDDAAAEGINASYKDGVLTVVTPKKESAQPKRIEIKVN